MSDTVIIPYSSDKYTIKDLGAFFSMAMQGDPLFTFLFPDEKARKKYTPLIMEVYLELGIKRGFVDLLTHPKGELIGGIITMGPDRSYINAPGFFMEMFRLRRLPLLAHLVIKRVKAIMELSDLVDAVHHRMPKRHYYVSMLGVLPEYRSKGLGARIMKSLLERSSHEGVPVYLESSNRRNLSFYERSGLYEGYRGVNRRKDFEVIFFCSDPTIPLKI